KIKVSAGFLCGTAVCDIFYHYTDDIFAGVQLDQADLRLAVYAPEEIADNLTKTFWDNNWWETDTEQFIGATRPSKRQNKNNFREYGNKKKKSLFLYKHRQLNCRAKSYSIEDIANLMIDHFQSMLANSEKIKNAISEITE
ncbi:MAG: hypothetical protein R6V56_03765, partial [Lentisphaeria bacterium]